MGLSLEGRLVVKRTFLEFVMPQSAKPGRARLFTDTGLLESGRLARDSPCTPSLAAASAEASPAELVQEWPKTPMLDAECAPQLIPVDQDAAAEAKAVLGMGAFSGLGAMQEGAGGQQWLLPDAAWLGCAGDEQQALYQQPWIFVPMGDMSGCSALPGAGWSDEGLWPAPPSSSSGADAAAGSASGAAHQGSPKLWAGEMRTTVMLRNMPSSLTRNMLLQMLAKMGFTGSFDMVYLPVDFSTGEGLGYAFINMVSLEAVPALWDAFHGLSAWGDAAVGGCGCDSDKACAVSWAEPNQGLAAHIERYRNSPVMHPAVPDEWKPALFSDGVRAEFPAPTKKIKAPKVRSKRSSAEAAA